MKTRGKQVNSSSASARKATAETAQASKTTSATIKKEGSSTTNTPTPKITPEQAWNGTTPKVVSKGASATGTAKEERTTTAMEPPSGETISKQGERAPVTKPATTKIAAETAATIPQSRDSQSSKIEKEKVPEDEEDGDDSSDSDFDEAEYNAKLFEQTWGDKAKEIEQQEAQKATKVDPNQDVSEETFLARAYAKGWKRPPSKQKVQEALARKRHTPSKQNQEVQDQAAEAAQQRAAPEQPKKRRRYDDDDDDDEDIDVGIEDDAAEADEPNIKTPMKYRLRQQDLSTRSLLLSRSLDEEETATSGEALPTVVITLRNPYGREATRTCYAKSSLEEPVKYAATEWGVPSIDIICRLNGNHISQIHPLMYLLPQQSLRGQEATLEIECSYASEERAAKVTTAERPHSEVSATTGPDKLPQTERVSVTLKAQGKRPMEQRFNKNDTVEDVLSLASEKWEVPTEKIKCQIDDETISSEAKLSTLIEDDDLEEYEVPSIQIDCYINS
eukprot:gb/GECG01014181.1/.p1 GENE.gb/GECG01014181.1/~~gb/GECG01014181.1/.p1  ORF type:complete len:504 (+),score=110.51 gb/GECG01014181.1/:1-1512(+)